jgi:hypothetical protein
VKLKIKSVRVDKIKSPNLPVTGDSMPSIYPEYEPLQPANRAGEVTNLSAVRI